MNHAAIRNAIFVWALTYSPPGTPVVWADQSAPQPAKPYVTLKISGPYRDGGFDETRYAPDGESFTVCGQRRLVVSVQVYGTVEDVTHQIAERLNFSLGLHDTKFALGNAGLAVADEGDIINVTVFVDAKWQPRFAFDVTLNTVATGTESPGWIETIDLTGNLSG